MARKLTDEQEKRHEKSARSNFKRRAEKFSSEVKGRKLDWKPDDSQMDPRIFEK